MPAFSYFDLIYKAIKLTSFFATFNEKMRFLLIVIIESTQCLLGFIHLLISVYKKKNCLAESVDGNFKRHK